MANGIKKGKPVNVALLVDAVRDMIDVPGVVSVLTASAGFGYQITTSDGGYLADDAPSTERWFRVVVMPERGMADRADKPGRVSGTEVVIRADACVPHSLKGFGATNALFAIQHAIFNEIEGQAAAMPVGKLLSPLKRIRFSDSAYAAEHEGKRLYSLRWVYTTIIGE